MTDHLEVARKVAREAADLWRAAHGLRGSMSDPWPEQNIEWHIADALDRAGLLRTGAEKEVMPRLTATVTAMILTGGLTGQHVGIAPDFDRLTDLHERALKACEAYCAKYTWPTYSKPREREHLYSAEAIVVWDIGRESLALKQPKPRWRADNGNSTDPKRWWAVYDSNAADGGAAFIFTEAQAHAVADALNKLGGER